MEMFPMYTHARQQRPLAGTLNRYCKRACACLHISYSKGLECNIFNTTRHKGLPLVPSDWALAFHSSVDKADEISATVFVHLPSAADFLLGATCPLTSSVGLRVLRRHWEFTNCQIPDTILLSATFLMSLSLKHLVSSNLLCWTGKNGSLEGYERNREISQRRFQV